MTQAQNGKNGKNGKNDGRSGQLQARTRAGGTRCASSVGKTAEGKPRRETAYARSASAARELLDKMRAAHGIVRGRGAERMPTLREYLDSWLARKTPEIEAKSIRNYRSSIDNLVPLIGHIRLDRLTAEIVARSLEELRKQKRQASARREAERITCCALRLTSAMRRDVQRFGRARR